MIGCRKSEEVYPRKTKEKRRQISSLKRRIIILKTSTLSSLHYFCIVGFPGAAPGAFPGPYGMWLPPAAAAAAQAANAGAAAAAQAPQTSMFILYLINRA